MHHLAARSQNDEAPLAARRVALGSDLQRRTFWSSRHVFCSQELDQQPWNVRRCGRRLMRQQMIEDAIQVVRDFRRKLDAGHA
jgi:hypothetical protein